MWLLLALMLLLGACQAQEDIEAEDKIIVIDTHPITFPPNQIEAATQTVINWAEEDAWRAGMLSWLAWLPGNNSTNRSIA